MGKEIYVNVYSTGCIPDAVSLFDNEQDSENDFKEMMGIGSEEYHEEDTSGWEQEGRIFLEELKETVKDQIVVIVRGGLVQAVYTNKIMDIIVLDYDNISASSDEEYIEHEKEIKRANEMIENMIMIY